MRKADQHPDHPHYNTGKKCQTIDAENEGIAKAKKNKAAYQPEVLANGDTLKQLLARSRYLLFKHPSKWTPSHEHRTGLLFQRYPRLKNAYNIAQKLGIYSGFAKVKSRLLKDWQYGIMKSKNAVLIPLGLLPGQFNRIHECLCRIFQCKDQSF